MWKNGKIWNLAESVGHLWFWQRHLQMFLMYHDLAFSLRCFVLFVLICRLLLWRNPFHARTSNLTHTAAGLSTIRCRLMTWRMSVNPLCSCLSTLPIICVPHIHMGSAWQTYIHSLPLPTTGLGPGQWGSCCESLWWWMFEIGHQLDVWVAPAILHLPQQQHNFYFNWCTHGLWMDPCSVGAHNLEIIWKLPQWQNGTINRELRETFVSSKPKVHPRFIFNKLLQFCSLNCET